MQDVVDALRKWMVIARNLKERERELLRAAVEGQDDPRLLACTDSMQRDEAAALAAYRQCLEQQLGDEPE